MKLFPENLTANIALNVHLNPPYAARASMARASLMCRALARVTPGGTLRALTRIRAGEPFSQARRPPSGSFTTLPPRALNSFTVSLAMSCPPVVSRSSE
jgi:hypothetical protein